MDSLIVLLSGICLLLGSILMLTGVIGVLRFPDFYSRMHAASVTDTLAVMLILVGLLLLSGWSLVSAKLVIIWVFLMFTGPTAAHALSKAAITAGLKPWQQPGSSSAPGQEEQV